MPTHTLRTLFNRIDPTITAVLARNGISLLRVSVGVIFLWFGALKLVPGLSPAEDLIRTAIWFLPPQLFIPVLALWEMAIGIGLISGRFTRATILLLLLQMPGTMLPVLLVPERIFTVFPIGLTLEGQYIVKNLVLVAAALVIGATARGGGLVDDPERFGRAQGRLEDA
ncbi:MAG: hypothetical protein RLZZ387_3023 [Chloroflexota bacterium]|jgi:uncharacterized membrane protein YphA (DoxX/SURF4 family)